jgi:hypothetical protein
LLCTLKERGLGPRHPVVNPAEIYSFSFLGLMKNVVNAMNKDFKASHGSYQWVKNKRRIFLSSTKRNDQK